MFIVTLFILIVALAICIKIYNKLTVGLCKCSKHLFEKVVIVTGANTGIGFETAKDLAERGARVILACRSHDKGITARDSIIASTGNNDVLYKHLDLASLASVKKFAEEIISTEKRIDILINNAGVFEVDNIQTEDGLSLVMQSNHFGPFLLINLLLPLLKSSAPSRIINVSSLAYIRGKIDFENISNEKETVETYNRTTAYATSKLCNIMTTLELAKRLEGTGVTSNCLHPGAVVTDILMKLQKSWFRHLMPILKHFFKTPWEGAQTTIFLAVSPQLENVSGKYFGDCKERIISDAAQDKEVTRKLWGVSEKLVGLKEY